MVMPRPKKQIYDPLIQAMIDRLPKPGDEFPRVERERWLALMKANMDLVYGQTGDMPPIVQGNMIADDMKPSFVNKYVKGHFHGGPTPPKFKPNKTPDFYVGEDGLCYNKAGDRIMPEDVKDRLVDLRGPDGNIDVIKWADDSTGLKGDILVTLE
jgi:hypothetical protein